jgi:hypothetical protein
MAKKIHHHGVRLSYLKELSYVILVTLNTNIRVHLVMTVEFRI